MNAHQKYINLMARTFGVEKIQVGRLVFRIFKKEARLQGVPLDQLIGLKIELVRSLPGDAVVFVNAQGHTMLKAEYPI